MLPITRRPTGMLLRRVGDRTALTTCSRRCATPCAKAQAPTALLVAEAPCEWLGRNQMPQTHSSWRRHRVRQEAMQRDRAHEWAPWLPIVEDTKTKMPVQEPKEVETKTDCELEDCGCKTEQQKLARDAHVLQQAQAKMVQEQQEQQRIAQRAQALVTHTEMESITQTKMSLDVITATTTNSTPPPSLALPKTSFHGRVLPTDCIAFSSPTGRRLFAEALSATPNYMQIYFPLAEQFITQAEPAYCGLAALAMCLNALHIDPGRLWKGAWRWFSEELFDCCTSLAVAKEKGIDLPEFICLARCNGVHTEAWMANETLTLDRFRKIVQASCATNDQIVVLNYSRQALGQTGDGHFSPIGGYHAERDMVLLLDVARYKYPPHWVQLSYLHRAMQRLDKATNKPRGLVILKEGAHVTGPTRIKPEMLTTA